MVRASRTRRQKQLLRLTGLIALVPGPLCYWMLYAIVNSSPKNPLHSYIYGDISDWQPRPLLGGAMWMMFFWALNYSVMRGLSAEQEPVDGEQPEQFTYLRQTGRPAGVLCVFFIAGSFGGILGTPFHPVLGLEWFCLFNLLVASIAAALGVFWWAGLGLRWLYRKEQARFERQMDKIVRARIVRNMTNYVQATPEDEPVPSPDLPERK